MNESDWVQLALWFAGVALAAGAVYAKLGAQTEQIQSLTKRFDEFEAREVESGKNDVRVMQTLLGLNGNGGLLAEMQYHRALHHWYGNCLQMLATSADVELPHRPDPPGII